MITPLSDPPECAVGMRCEAEDISVLIVDTLANDPDKVNVIRESLRAVGQRLPLLVEYTTNKVLRGAATVVAMRQLAMEDASDTNPTPDAWHAAWVVRVTAEECESVAMMLADRQSAELNELDFTQMYAQFGDALDAQYEPGEVAMMQTEVAHILGMGPQFEAQRKDIRYDQETATVNTEGTKTQGRGLFYQKLERSEKLADAAHQRTRYTPGSKATELVKGGTIVHLSEEQMTMFLLCYTYARDEYDQGEITHGEAFAYIVRQWMRGKGREIPPERPAPEF